LSFGPYKWSLMNSRPKQPENGEARAYWREAVAGYETPSWGRATLDLLLSAGAYIALMVAMYLLVGEHPWLVLLLALPTSGFLLRTFIVFHDCAHGSFVPSRRGNLWIGRFAALLVFQPFANWRHNHAVHHGTSGDLDRRGQGDVETLTVAEYNARSPKARLAYRLFRSPAILFTVGPLWSLMFGPRFWNKNMRPRQIHSVWLTNIALFILVGATIAVVGPVDWLLVQMPAALLAGVGGVFLFYVQHQYEDAYWETGESWDYADAALKGSSYLKLSPPMRFFSGNIGLHHVHHLSAKIPNYNLQRAHEESPIFADVPILTFADGVRSLRLKLIDLDAGRLLTFREARELTATRLKINPTLNPEAS
jgi:acyl-lipid omega-6 desaturase (Delta-12 desaturase)